MCKEIVNIYIDSFYLDLSHTIIFDPATVIIFCCTLVTPRDEHKNTTEIRKDVLIVDKGFQVDLMRTIK